MPCAISVTIFRQTKKYIDALTRILGQVDPRTPFLQMFWYGREREISQSTGEAVITAYLLKY